MLLPAASASQARWGPEAQGLEIIAAIETVALQLLGRACVKDAEPSGGAPQSERDHHQEPAAAMVLALFDRKARRRNTRHPVPPQLQLMAMLDSVHRLLVCQRHATLRQLFYTHASLFRRQEHSNEVLKQMCTALRVPRHYLRLAGTVKALVRGHLRILEPGQKGEWVTNRDDTWIDCCDPLEPRGHPISPLSAHMVHMESTARTIIVVEKETIFHRLLEEGFLERHRPCVLITARGFPDLPTRYFLRRIREECGEPRVLLLVDFDAYGLSIAATYAFGTGSATWVQEEELTLPEAFPWLCSDLTTACAQYGLRVKDTMPLTSRDRGVASGLQRRFSILEARHGAACLAPWRTLVAQMLEGDVKYELDALDSLVGFVERGIYAMHAVANEPPADGSDTAAAGVLMT